MANSSIELFGWERTALAVEKVKDRLKRTAEALAQANVPYAVVGGNAVDVEMFLDGPDGRPKDAVHLVFAVEKVQSDYATPAPDTADSEKGACFRVVSLAAMGEMKLNAYHLKDRLHLVDLIDVGLIDATWLPRLPSELAPRLQRILENPDA
jgi:hypothetical protein